MSEVARLAYVSRDGSASIVDHLERLGLVERRRAGRAHLVSLIEENPVIESLRAIEHVHERSVHKLRHAARAIKPAPQFMALYGSWARGEASEESDLEFAIVLNGAGDRNVLLEAIDRWSRVAHRVTGRVPSIVIADDTSEATGPLWDSIRRDTILLVGHAGGTDGA